MVKISCPFHDGGCAACAHPSGTGRTDATTFGSIQRTATSRAGSAARTLAATLTAGVSCTSTDVAVPITRWFVAIEPRSRRSRIPTRGWSASRARRRCPAIWSGGTRVGLERRRGRSSRSRGHDLRVVGCQLERRVAAGGDVHDLRPLVRLAVERDRPVRFHRVVSRDAACTSAVPSSAVTIRRGDALAGLSLMSSAWRGTGVAFRSASTRTTLI